MVVGTSFVSNQRSLRFAAQVKPEKAATQAPETAPSAVGEQKTGSDQAFFPDQPFPSALTRPKGFLKNVAYFFNMLFNSRKIMTPLERSLCELLDEMNREKTNDKIELQGTDLPYSDDYHYTAEILMDGKPYTLSVRKGEFYEYNLSSVGPDISLFVKSGPIATYEDKESRIHLQTTNGYAASRAKKTLKRIYYAVLDKEAVRRKHLEMEKLKHELELEKLANAGRKLRI